MTRKELLKRKGDYVFTIADFTCDYNGPLRVTHKITRLKIWCSAGSHKRRDEYIAFTDDRDEEVYSFTREELHLVFWTRKAALAALMKHRLSNNKPPHSL